MAFRLQLTDNVETVDLMGSIYRVMDGGFDISLPRSKREIAEVTPGKFIPVSTQFDYREAKLTFQVFGATRSAVLSSINKIERILRSAENRQRWGQAGRVELSYAWDGATNVTYFEVYGGEFKFPADVMSLAKLYASDSAGYYVPECELSLYLSPEGYGVSLYSDTLTELPLYRDTCSAKATGGLAVQNPGNSQYNYVTIDADDVLGDRPYLTKLSIASSSPYDKWHALYIGHQLSPFPSSILHDDSEIDDNMGGSPVNEGNASGGTYISHTVSSTTPAVDFFQHWGWVITNNSFGTFLPFAHTWSGLPTGVQLAAGINGVVSLGLNFRQDFVAMKYSGQYTIPLSMIQIPFMSPDLASYGNIATLYLGLYRAYEGSHTLTLDYLSLLPIGNGVRILRSRVNNSTYQTGTYWDDGWKDLLYLKDGANVRPNVLGLMETIKLEPNRTQRLYFTCVGGSSAVNDRQRTFNVRVYAVPTYHSLAL